MKTIVILEITHSKPIADLANMIAGRAYTLQGVDNAKPLSLMASDAPAFGMSFPGIGRVQVVEDKA